MPVGWHGNDVVLLVIIFGPMLLLLIWFIGNYNRLVKLSNMIPESWANIDTELRRRYDLIPNLVNTVKAYAEHEKAIFQAVAKARASAIASSGAPEEQAAEENELVRALRRLLAVTEAYPNLKADRNFLQLQNELVNTEDRIQAARRFYNGNIRDYNNVVETFPSGLIASLCGFRRKEFFEIEELQARYPVSVGF
jgi:LemA protein